MPVGLNPGIYADIIAEVYTPDTAGAATNGLFFVFSPKGEDNQLKYVTNNAELIKRFGTPNLRLYGQSLYNAYNFSRVSGNTIIHRTLPNLEDTPTAGYPDPTYVQMPATYANLFFFTIPSTHPTDNLLLIPNWFIPPQFSQQLYVDTVYYYETGDLNLKDTNGVTFGITKSNIIYLNYYDTYTNIGSAGLFNNAATVTLPYPTVRTTLQELDFYTSTDTYIQNFLANMSVTLTVTPGSVPTPPIVNYVTITPSTTTTTLNLTGTGLENLPNLLVYVNGTFVDPTTITWSSPNLTLPNPVGPTDTVQIIGLIFSNHVVIPGGGSTVLPPNSYPFCVDCNGVVDFNQTNYDVFVDPATGNVTITNLDPSNDLHVFYDTNIGINGDYLIDTYSQLVTYDNSGSATVTFTINPDYVAQTLGYSIAVYVDGVPVNFTYSGNQVNLTLTGTPGTNSVVTIQFTQVNDPNASITGKAVWGIHGKGRGGWYNKLAVQITPNFEETSTKFLPNPSFYTLTTFVYDSRIGNYMPGSDRFEFNVNYDGLDDYGRKADLETLVNTYGTDIFVFQNREYLDQLQQQAPIDNRFNNRWEEVAYKTLKILAGRKLKLKGGAEGCVRRTDGFIYWPVATSILMNAIQGVYDPDIYNLDKVVIDAVFDADFPDAVKVELVNLCDLRQDCVAFLDVPKYPDIDSVTTWVDNFGINSALAALYTPHMEIFSQFDQDYVVFAPSYVMSFLVPFVDRTFGFWQPIAGKTRGNIRFDVKRFIIDIPLTENSSDLTKLVVRQVNALGRKQGTNVVWGNYTLYKVPSALQSLHASRITAKLYRDLRTALNAVLWDLMTPTLRSQIKNIVMGVLSNYIGTAIEPDVQVDVQYTDYDRMQRMARVYVTFRPYLELRKIQLFLTVQ